jgi:hypothetical protein
MEVWAVDEKRNPLGAGGNVTHRSRLDLDQQIFGASPLNS